MQENNGLEIKRCKAVESNCAFQKVKERADHGKLIH